jgi:hypothetical protein
VSQSIKSVRQLLTERLADAVEFAAKLRMPPEEFKELLANVQLAQAHLMRRPTDEWEDEPITQVG